MCQEFRIVAELNWPEEGAVVSSRQDAEGACPDVLHVMPDCKHQEVNPRLGGRDTRKDCAESVLAVQLSRSDSALVVVGKEVEEKGGVFLQSRGMSAETGGKGGPQRRRWA